ncbi:3-deoxy-D-manno-octulosonic acid transferase [Palleronia sp. KMU-117]|uniref:3-deoxy-D-manno-octulosonic acid transferase n=1 Tax=Palleronia sp. KMU-117 TaxID=3434108 RepID=UPI003D73D856
MPPAGDPARRGPALRLYLAASRVIPLVAPAVLRRRLARGKEDPQRWQEKLGRPTMPRPDGPLVWLHAVGLGEVLALRGLIAAVARQRDGLSFLITSTARSSAGVVAANLPPRTSHQFLPLDAPRYLAPFLDHWRPDLAIWSEQDLWPGAVAAAQARGIPLAYVNVRITAESARRRAFAAAVYRDTLSCFALIAAQEEGTAARLRSLGAGEVRVTGSLKSAAPPLAADPDSLDRLRALLAGRRPWVAASTHPGDEEAAIAAAVALRDDPADLLILVPRDPGRADAIAARLGKAGLQSARRSAGEVPASDTRVWLADTYGELGLWYRLADRALIGGGFDAIGGHNPWEAACLDTAILHGPDVANFAADYAALHAAGAAREVRSDGLATALEAEDLPALAARARALVEGARGALDPLAVDLLALMDPPG